MTRLNWVNNHYTYYSDYLFNHLHDSAEVKLKVYFRVFVLDSHPWKPDFKIKYPNHLIKGWWGLNAELLKRALTSRDYFVLAGWNSLLYVLLISILTIRRAPFAIYTDTPKPEFRRGIINLKWTWLKWVFSPSRQCTLLVTGEVGVNRAVQFLPVEKEHVVNFPFVTDLDFFRPQPNPKKHRHSEMAQFLSVGRIDFPHKGQDLTILALQKLLEKGYSRFYYRIAGTGQDEMQLQQLIEAAGLKDHVQILGWVEIKDLPALFSSVHFTIHSSHEDPFPNAVLESLCCGIPVIGSDKAGSAVERIVPGVNGYLHESGNVDSLTHYLVKALELSDDEYRLMCQHARTMAQEWTPDYNVEVIHSLLHKAAYSLQS
jgi:glycosyltransferase involved in cell wall biosynthesis